MPHVSPLSLSDRQMQLLIALGAPLVFLHVVDYIIEQSPGHHRDLANVDLFSGEGAINRAFGEGGLKSKSYDKATDGMAADITTTEGFFRAVQLILRLQSGGLITGGPPCSSFIYLNVYTSGRSKSKPLGGQYQYVKTANVIVCRLVLLLLLGFVRCAVCLIEQPASTLMPYFPCMVWLARTTGLFYPWMTTKFCMAVYGHRNLKPTITLGSAPWAYKLRKQISPSVRKRVRKAKPMVRKYVDKKGKKRVCGNPSVLRKSQVYPMGYGRAICKLHKKWMDAPGGGGETLRTILYPPEGGLHAATLKKVTQAPYRWRHARLSALPDFLKSEKAVGRYHPLLDQGLDQ